MTDEEIERALGLETSPRARVLEEWIRVFDERWSITGGSEPEHCIEFADYYAWKAQEPRREDYGDCHCTLDYRHFTKKCESCERFKHDHFWWTDRQPGMEGV